MMLAFNKVMLLGKISVEPKYIKFHSGGAVWQTRLSVAGNRKRNDVGEFVDIPMFIEVKAFNRQNSHRQLADLCRDGFHRDDEIFITGKLIFDEWTDSQTGIVKSRHVVEIDDAESIHIIDEELLEGDKQGG